MATSQTLQISANEFVLNLWDADSDGVSNLDELIAGTDQELVQVIKERLREFSEPYDSINPIRALTVASGYYEPRIPARIAGSICSSQQQSESLMRNHAGSREAKQDQP